MYFDETPSGMEVAISYQMQDIQIQIYSLWYLDLSDSIARK